MRFWLVISFVLGSYSSARAAPSGGAEAGPGVIEAEVAAIRANVNEIQKHFDRLDGTIRGCEKPGAPSQSPVAKLKSDNEELLREADELATYVDSAMKEPVPTGGANICRGTFSQVRAAYHAKAGQSRWASQYARDMRRRTEAKRDLLRKFLATKANPGSCGDSAGRAQMAKIANGYDGVSKKLHGLELKLKLNESLFVKSANELPSCDGPEGEQPPPRPENPAPRRKTPVPDNFFDRTFPKTS